MAVSTPADWRRRFLLHPSLVPLNHGSFGACPAEVMDHVQALQREAEADLSGHYAQIGERLASARTRLAEALDGEADSLAFVPNATTGVQVAVDSVPLQPGDEVLTTDLEYGACLAQWARRCAETGAVLRVVPVPLPLTEAGFTEALAAALGPRTRVLFASAVTSATALVLPLAPILAAARAAGVTTVVDAAHAPGLPLHAGQPAFSLRRLDADFCTGNLHKWICAPKGAAFLHVSPRWHARVRPPVASWGQVPRTPGAAVIALDAITGTDALQRALQWQGTRDLSAFLAVPAVLDWWRRHDPPAAADAPPDAPGPARQAARARALALLERHVKRWNEIPLASPMHMGAMVTLPLPPWPAGPGAEPRAWTGEAAAALQQRLRDDHGIVVPVTTHGGRAFIRVSGAVYVGEDDLQRLEAAWPAACDAVFRPGAVHGE